MMNAADTFILDPRLREDTFVITEEENSVMLLMNDARWPWIILVPKVPGAEELHDLDDAARSQIINQTMQISKGLRAETGCEKINIGALGNMVRQLHIHIIARKTGDPNWPGPVWGFGEREAYDEATANYFVAQWKEIVRVAPLC